MGYFYWDAIPRAKDDPTRIAPFVAARVALYDQLAELLDVNIPAPADGEVLAFHAASGKWIAGAAAAEWHVLAEVDVTENCDYVDFTSLDINTDRFYILFVNAKNPTGSSYSLLLFRNDDYTATNYYTQFIGASGTTVSAGRENRPGFIYLPAGIALISQMFIGRDPDGYMQATGLSMRNRGANVHLENKYISSTNTTANITSIRIAAQQSGGIGAGSKLLLCRPRS